MQGTPRHHFSWFGPKDRPLAGWLDLPAAGESSTVVVIAPPIGYEYWSTHRTLRELASMLVAEGNTVLRFDYDGTGDSAGECWDENRLAAWKRSLREAVQFVRGGGARRIVVVGLRFGATLALLEAHALGVDAVVAWAPVILGRRYRREIEFLATPVPLGDNRPRALGGVVFAGFGFSPATLDEIALIDLTALDSMPAPVVLLIDRPDRPASSAFVRVLHEFGVAVSYECLAGTDQALDRAAEDAVAPVEILRVISRWVGSSPFAQSPVLKLDGESSFSWRSSVVREWAVTIGTDALVGVRTAPNDGGERGVVVFLNSGSEPHIGPGRAWVEYARELACAGWGSVRVDLSGWGESPDDGHAPGRPYDAHGLGETARIIEALRKSGDQRIVIAGLCAGAWVALAAAFSADGIIAINPQMYWMPGDPVEALLSDTRARRAPLQRRYERINRLGIWTLLDIMHFRPRPGRWLDEIANQGLPVLFLFAAGDDGIRYLRTRLGRRLASVLRDGHVELREINDIDHPMHEEWRRHDVVSAMVSFLYKVATGSARADDGTLRSLARTVGPLPTYTMHR